MCCVRMHCVLEILGMVGKHIFMLQRTHNTHRVFNGMGEKVRGKP